MKTAYGIQGKQLAHLFKSLGHQVTYLCYSGFKGELDWDGIRILGSSDNGVSLVPLIAPQQDFCLIFFDLWTLPISFIPAGFWGMSPIDSDPPCRKTVEMLRRCCQTGGGVISISRFHQKMCHQAGLESVYIPHWVDDSVFRPGDKLKSREKLGWDPQAIIIGINAANVGIRKNLDGMIQAFAEAREENKSLKLALHTRVKLDPASPDGLPLNELLVNYGLKDHEDVYVVDQAQYQVGLPDSDLAIWYNGLDFFMLCSLGEGFGIPIAEAALCRIPSIVSDVASAPEVAGPGWTVPATEDVIFPLNQTIMKRTHHKDIAATILKAAALDKHTYIHMQQAVFEHARKNYTPDVVVNNWKELLNRIVKRERLC